MVNRVYGELSVYANNYTFLITKTRHVQIIMRSSKVVLWDMTASKELLSAV